ncbi:restriction endonuclease subunit S [Clostridium sp.]|uniref:restriction endonuclease subunit S n=1 Tax=Clostridium sp. TaxID=1506 RepID=UPI0025C2A690|nr:restriction endonuclease subunit S [Clostridium sp.]
MKKLVEVCTEIKDGDWIESKDQSETGIRLVQTGNVGNGIYLEKNERAKYISEDTFNNLKCTEIFAGDILISRLPSPVGRACIFPNINERAITAVDCTILRVDKKICLPKYLVYYTKSNLYSRQIGSFVVGTTRLRISRKNLEGIKIKVPSLQEQEKIVRILDKAQELIDKRKEQIETLDELVKSKFIEMFGNLKNEEKVPLEKCTTFIDYRGKTPTLSDNGIRIINAKSVGNGFFKYIEEYISEETYNLWMKRGFPVAGDVLFVTEGHTFGNVCRIPNDLTKFAMGQRVITMQGENGMLNNAFLAQYMQSMAFKIDIDKYKTGSSAQGIRSKELQKILIPIPDIKFQNQFADFVKQVEKLKLEMEQSLKELEDNFNSLMQRAYKGELFN